DSDYGRASQDRKSTTGGSQFLGRSFQHELDFKCLNNLQPKWKQYATMMRQNKNLMDINIDALYNILKQNQGVVNDAMGLKKKNIMVTFDPLAFIAEKTKVCKRKEKVVVSSDAEGSDADDFSEMKKITALLAKAFNRRKFYSKPTNNKLRTSSTSQSANKKQEFVKMDDKKDDEKKQDMSKVKCYNCKKERHFPKDCKKAKVKDYNYYKTKMLLAKKDSDEQVLIYEDQAWMESSNSDTSSSSADDKISEVSYYLFKSKSESEYETSNYYDNTTTYGLFVNDNHDQEIFHDCENFLENLIESQIDHNESAVDHNDSKEVDKKIIIYLEDEVVSLLEKEKANLETIESLKSKEEIARVLTSMDAATVLAGEANVPTGNGFIPTAGPPTTIVSTGSEVGPTASPIVQRRKGKEVMVESDTPKKKKLQEQIDAQVARELEEQQEREDMRMNEQIARDAEVARIHAEE
nr:hypothetical protein [Tanacetum cinerariifolium]